MKNSQKKAAEYIEHFSIAIHGSTPEIHNAITLVKESFDETLLGLKNLVKYTDKITGKIVISKHNSKDLKNILFLLNSIGVKNSNVTFPHANGNAAKNFVEVVPYYGEIKDYITECIEYAYSVNHNLKLEAILPCTFDVLYPTELFADFECQFDNVRLHQLNEKETLNWKKIRREIKMKGDICDKCMFNSICEGYWMEYVQVRGFNEFTPITEETVYAFSDKV
ncbi:MAG: hypothetical protein LUH07_11805 [Lachnospiraceae bacterium]|nr:hypothetical protein [Lachnospiraceae bacterium]